MSNQIPDPESLVLAMSKDLASATSLDPFMIGIHTGGVWVAERLHTELNLSSSLGSININFYRHDFSRIGLHPQVSASEIPENIEGRHLILVDDVLQSGRTIRAALNEIFSYGRPDSVRLAVLVERGDRELPIQPDVVGLKLPLPAHQHIKLTGPETLALVLSER